MPTTLIAVQDAYIETVNAGLTRWSHRKGKGHAHRIARGAWHTAERALRKLGFTDQTQIDRIIADARDMAALLRISED